MFEMASTFTQVPDLIDGEIPIKEMHQKNRTRCAEDAPKNH